MHRALVLIALPCGCGPGSSFVAPDLHSVACESDAPIRIAAVPGGTFGIRRFGDAFGVITLEDPGPDERFVTYAVDPCGAIVERRLVESWALPAGSGWTAPTPASLLWAEHLDALPVTMPITGNGWLHSFETRGLFVVDEVERDLFLFTTPGADPVVIATDIDPDALSEEYRSPIQLMMAPYAVEGDEVWYLSDAGTLVHVDLATGVRTTISTDVRALHSSTVGGIVAWVEPAATEGGPPLESTILRVSTGETVRLPGAVRDLDFPGLVVTGFREQAFIHDLDRGRTRTVETLANARVVRADTTSAFLVVESASAEWPEDLVHVDMTTGAAKDLTQGLAATLDARIDPFSQGILVFAAEADDPRGYGRILRFTAEASQEIAENISRLHRIASDGRVIYVDGDPVDGETSLRIRSPDGSDDLVARDAMLYDAMRLYDDPHFPGTYMADLQGDVLYSIETGPDRGLWRMPFEHADG